MKWAFVSLYIYQFGNKTHTQIGDGCSFSVEKFQPFTKSPKGTMYTRVFRECNAFCKGDLVFTFRRKRKFQFYGLHDSLERFVHLFFLRI